MKLTIYKVTILFKVDSILFFQLIQKIGSGFFLVTLYVLINNVKLIINAVVD